MLYSPDCFVYINLQRVTPRVPSTLAQELYVFGKLGLTEQFNVRMCSGDEDTPGVKNLVQTLALGKEILDDLRQFIKSYRDDVSQMDVVIHYTRSSDFTLIGFIHLVAST